MFFQEVETKYFKLCEKVQQIFPHIEDISIFFQETNELKYLNNGKYLNISTFLKDKLSSLRLGNLNYQWMLPSEIFEFQENDQTNIHQLDILSEHDNKLLLLNFKSEIDGLNDLICLNFPKEIRFLGLYKTVKNLTTEDKILIGELLHKLIEVEIESQKNILKKQSRIAEYYKLRETAKTNISLDDYYNYIKLELNLGLDFLTNGKIAFDYDNELIDYFINKKYTIKIVCEFLKDSFETIQLIEEMNGNFKFQLYHFKLIENDKMNQNILPLPFSKNNDKIIDLLDKLESAAKSIESKGMVINGKIIAKFLLPPVSPPAITEILKKNIIKIEMKLIEYPTKWILIRKYLKPLRELEFKQQIANYNQKIS